MDTGNWITLGAVVVALGIGVASILHTQGLQRKEKKQRLLKEIIDWAIALHTGPLNSVLPFIDKTRIRELYIKKDFTEAQIIVLEEGVGKDLEIYVESQKNLTIGKALALCDFIEAIAEKEFPKLLKKVKRVTKETVFSYILKCMSEGEQFDEAIKSLGGKYIKEAREELEKKIDNKEKAKIEYNKSLTGSAVSINSLLKEVANNMP